ncbi:DUF397 domain-containing protein [Actinacidiphila sp. bgisy160]|uniref:DUF397 domain-containing protein n=1 Tax=Actinacidiphila sp. bgisy160 TaxID=3413796 RepID=UPI003D72A491
MSGEPSWRKSTYSDTEGSNCVEVATTPHGVRVRDSKDPDGPSLSFTPAAWTEFLRDVGRDAAPPSE